MSISFLEIPNNVRHPMFMVEFDPSNAMRGAGNQVYKALAIGQMLSTGSAAPLTPLRMSGKQDAVNCFGAGSMLAEMVEYYRNVDKVTELFAIAVPADSAGTKAKGTVTVTGTAAESGALYVYVNGTRFTVSVRNADDAATVCSALAVAINETAGLPVTAKVGDGKVTLEAVHPGEAGNGLDVRFNYHSGETFPGGLALSFSGFAGGGANPDIADALAVVASEWYNAFLMPYTDSHNLLTISDHLREMWSPLQMREGWLFSAIRGTFGELCDFGGNRNSPHECFMQCRGIPNSPWAVAAATAACAMYYGNMDQTRPFQTLPLTGILAPAIPDRFGVFPESNQLLYNGISNFYVDDSDTVRVGRLITTYKKSANGADDTAYLDLNTGLTLGYLRWDLRNYFMRKYPRHKLADDSTRFSAGQAIMTPKLAKAECVNKFQDWMERGLVENLTQFKEELIVERNASDPNRLDFRLPPDLVNQFIVGAVRIQFYL